MAGSNAAYKPDRDCFWLLTAPPGQDIKLKFNKFEVEKGYDFVHLYDGDSPTGREIARETGDLSDVGSYFSSSNKMLVRLTTDASVQWEGFSAHYTAVPECGTASAPRWKL